jgi:predicted RND superfamily exporter protein
VPARTLAIADNWRGVTALACVLALAGWVALHFVPIQTDVQRLVSSSLPELVSIQTVQAETGYTNEVDVYVRGQVAGPYDQAGTPQNIEWQCGVASDLRQKNQSVATATSIADFFIASTSQTAPTSGQLCVQSPSSTSPGGSPSPSPSPSPSASSGSTPSATPAAAHGVRSSARLAAATPTPTPAPSASPSASARPSPTPSPGTQQTPKQQTRFLCNLRLFPLLSRVLVAPISTDTQACPPVDEFQQRFITTDTSPIDPNAARIALGVRATSVSDEAHLVDEVSRGVTTAPNGMEAQPSGLAVLATTAYDNLNNRSYLLNLVPIAAVALALLAIYRERRRALLPLLPAVLAAGWAPLVVLLLGRLPGGLGATLGSFNPLTIVLGGLVIALGTEFGVMLLSRFYEARRRGLDPDGAAGAAVSGVGRPIAVSALTLGAGFAVLALSGLFPNAFPLIAAFGLSVVIDLTLAVAAVFLVMLPLAVALERSAPLVVVAEVAPAAAEPARAARRRAAQRRPARAAKEQPLAPAGEAAGPASPAPEATADGARRRPGVSGRRRRPAPADGEPAAAQDDEIAKPRRPGVSGRRRGNRRPHSG